MELETTVFGDGAAFARDYAPEWDVLIVNVGPGNLDGIAVMRSIRQRDTAVEAILVSMTEDQALEGYEVAAASYILKPPSYEAFARDMDRCRAASRTNERHAIEVMSGGKLRRICLDEIIYVDSVRHRTVMHTVLGNLQITCSIVRLEERLAALDHAFVKANSGYLVNLDHVMGVDGHEAVMSNGDRLLISRPRRTEFKRLFAEHLAARS
ncbi:response regulator transcription factor [Bifidobacterium pullorum subsp. saeculare]|uniref:Response regulator transcription factor n=1 Tax=Bifidobacterium pullorum subsp. saeculare TaxID=78257 RepID=A0A939BAB4_9BIFI|nr:LytTR family DNA-binding domain-containing protein [Bifidobacterium pullorum]MBM6700413.1 response regulator transcription factor [Bifidobacterium pullorum subsp. saeculare]